MTATDLAALLDELGRRLGPAGQHVFELAVRNAIISAVIWASVWTVVAVIAGIVCVAALRRTRTLADLYGNLSDKVDASDTERNALRDKVHAFEKEKEAAQLAAMTDAERADWWKQMAGFPFLGTGYYGFSSDLDQLDRANARPYAVAGAALVICVAAAFAVALWLPTLLNPEYAGLRDILAAVGGIK